MSICRSALPRVILSTGLLSSAAMAEFTEVWEIGQSGPLNGNPTGVSEVAPGSSTLRDDHFYLSDGEAVANFENALTSEDAENLIYFDLAAADLPDAAFRLVFAFDQLTLLQPTVITALVHEVSVTLNGTEVFVSPLFTKDGTEFVIDFPEGLAAESNVLKFERSGLTPDSSCRFDFIRLERDPTRAADDGDAVSSIPDTDGDGLNDELEAAAGTNPALADSDGDGAFDGWEIATGYDPTLSSSTPPDLRAFGLNFVSEEDPGFGAWNETLINGFIPQTRWNQTYPLQFLSESELSNYSEANSATPITNSNLTQPATDANGNASPITFSIPRPDGMSAQSAYGRDDLKTRLLNGALTFVNQPSQTLELSGIDFANYDLYVYVSSIYKRAASEVATTTLEVAGTTQEISIESVSKLIPFRLPRPNTLGRPDFANVVKFENLTQGDGTLSIKITHDAGSNVAITSGIAAIQLIDRVADSDSSGIPDFWELMHATGNAPTADPDNDSLNNLAEFQNGTDPNKADTDEDGLTDGDEVTRGTNPTLQDSDGDRLSDYDEINHPLPSDPLLINTDSTGGDDLAERLAGTDPADATADDFPTPQQIDATGFFWELSNIRLAWNRNTTLQSDVNNNGQIVLQATCNITNISDGQNAFGILLREEPAGTKYRFNSNPQGFRRRINNQGANIEINGDANITNLDLQTKMGFSGVGSRDLSDRLTFTIEAAPEPLPADAPNWTFTARIKNESTNIIIFEETRSVLNNANHGVLPADHLINGTPLNFSIDILSGSAIEVLRSEVEIANNDADNDGIDDTWETNNSITDPDADPDSDGLTNLEEFLLQTDPNIADSDGDGFSDREEHDRFSDPNDTLISPPANNILALQTGDFNSNGIRDSWEATYGFTNQAPLTDSDGDGVSNKDESIAGTDPFDSNSRLFLRAVSSIDGDNTIEWPALDFKNITLGYSDDISGFTPVIGTPSTTNGIARMTFPQIEDGDFYRIQLDELDEDSDGVSNFEEALLGTSPTDPSSSRRSIAYDSDGNGSLDATHPGDYLALTDFLRNREGLGNASGSINPSNRDAARLLMQATFGPTLQDIHRVRKLGIEAWLNEQFAKPASTHFDLIQAGVDNARGAMVDNQFGLKNFGLETSSVSVPFSKAAVLGEDQLRQRVAFALSQIFVVSFRDSFLNARPLGLTNYYDIFTENAFGNFEDILRQVTFHPVMGTYLSHVGNEKSAPQQNQFPDENYAREVMQLFSIGLWELHQDGTRKKDLNGNDIPTYDTEDITELAKVMTGFLFANANSGRGSRQDITYTTPMRVMASRHDFTEKNLLKGRLIIPSRANTEANATRDIDDALRMLFLHENTPPFISQALIGFLVTNNPTPQYVSDIASAFIDNGSGTRGDMKAVVRAILLHREARSPDIAELEKGYGRLRDPLLRFMHLAKMIGMQDREDFVWFDNGNLFSASGQSPLGSPSVFNFYQPDYSPPGALSENQLLGGPFQLVDTNSAVSFPNLIWEVCTEGYRNPVTKTGEPDGLFPPTFREALPFANDTEALLDYVNLVVCGGKMQASTRAFIKTTLDSPPLDDPRRIHHKVSLALYAAFISSDSAIQR